MECSLDHSKLTGLRFCTACGTPLTGQNASLNAARTSAPPPQQNANPVLSAESVSFNFPSPVSKNPQFQKRNMLFAIAGATCLVLFIGIAVLISAKPEPVAVTASLTIVDESCYGLGWGYLDVPGAQVILTVDGVIEGYGSYPRVGTSSILGCKFTTTFYDIPSDGEMYSYSLASGRRGVITKSQSELESSGWSFDLTLG